METTIMMVQDSGDNTSAFLKMRLKFSQGKKFKACRKTQLVEKLFVTKANPLPQFKKRGYAPFSKWKLKYL